VGNVVVNNAPPGGQDDPRWFAIYVEDAEGIEVNGNTVTDNIKAPNLRGLFGAIGLQGVAGMIRVQNNVVRDNGGLALFIGETRRVFERLQHALVENNQFSEGTESLNPTVQIQFVDSLVFSGNQCRRSSRGPFTGAVAVQSFRAIVSGNCVEAAGLGGMFVDGNEVVVTGNLVTGDFALLFVGPTGARMVVTSNMAALIITPTSALRGLNSPPP
jgi:parallel beta helix pectate lyase-like protein